jgi:hypothetical protein
LRKSSAARLAVAYFNPNDRVLAALKGVTRLSLTVSRDFQLVNPYKLESLCRGKNRVSAIPDEPNGKFHTKVYLAEQENGTCWAMVGSANLTEPGLFTSQEACITLDSRNPCDEATLAQIKKWLDTASTQEQKEIDFEVAKTIWNNRAKYKLTSEKLENKGTAPSTKAGAYWALKPGESGWFWENFKAESVVAMGWSEINCDASRLTRGEVEARYRATRQDAPDGQVAANVAQIVDFTQHMGVGNLVLICGRYTAIRKDKNEAYIYGIARTASIDGKCYFYDRKSDWYRFKRHATIQPIEEYVSRRKLRRALGKGAFVRTIITLDQPAFSRLDALLHAEFGVSIVV